MSEQINANRLVALHNANHHNVGLGAFAATRDGKALWQPLAAKGLICRDSAKYCGVLSITRKGRELLQSPVSEIAKTFDVDVATVERVLALPFEVER